MALDATIGGPDSNSYLTLAEANIYFANHYSLAKSTAWVALTPGQGESVLKRATQMIDSLRVLDDEYGYGPLPPALVVYDFHDLNLHRLAWNQRLSFPRNIDVDDDLVGYIQQAVKDAECEQASYLLAFDETAIVAAMTMAQSLTACSSTIRPRTLLMFNAPRTAPTPNAPRISP